MSCIAGETVPVGRWRCLLFVTWMNIGSTSFNDFSFTLIQPVLNLVFNKVENVVIFHVKFKLLGSKTVPSMYFFVYRYANVLWMTVTVLGKYLNYAFLIVAPDIWFYVVISESVKHIELVKHVNIVIITRWTFVCMT